jgi:phospholipase/carboxylesterase
MRNKMLQGPVLLPHSGEKAKKLVVLCHGYGANGADLLGLAPYWSQSLPHTEFLSPNAPEIWESYPSGYQWFSLKEFTPQAIRNGLDKAAPILRDYLLDALQQRDLKPQDLAIVGFSQGGMMALEMLFAIQGIGGLICYSGGFFPKEGVSLPSKHPHILLIHGDNDQVVPYDYFLESQRNLKKLGLNPQTLTCAGLGHSIDEEGLNAGGKFLTEIFT